MTEKLKLLLKLIDSYGLLQGASIGMKLQSKNLEGLVLPNIKFPISLRPGTTDVPTFYQVFLNQHYKIKLPQAPKVIIDGGANIGLFTVLMKNLYPEATVICVEPDPENFAQLKKNVANYENVHCENCGIWDKDVMLKVYDKYKAGKWAMVVEEDAESGTVPAISMDTLLKKYGIEKVDLLKLDIESSEKQVFSQNYESWLPKAETLVVELHDGLVPGCGRSFFEAINKTFPNYRFNYKGENVIIYSQGFWA